MAHGDGGGAAPGGAGVLAPVHEGLPLLGEERFAAPIAAHRLVTFLNRTLKRRGLVFGLSQEDGGVCLRIYTTDSGPSGPIPEPKEGERIGDTASDDPRL